LLNNRADPSERPTRGISRLDLLAYAVITMVGVFILLTPLRARNLTGDAVRYVGLADSIVEARGYEFNFRPHTRFPPGLPIVLAVIRGATGGGYEHYIAAMAVFGFLSLIASYTLLRTLGHPRLGLVAVLAVASSPIFYERATLDVSSDLPFFFFILVALTVATRVESGAYARGKLLRSVTLGLLVVSTAMIRSVGLALLGSLFLWILLRLVTKKRPSSEQLWSFAPALLLGLLSQGAWWWWQSLNHTPFWPGEFMSSYFSQLLLKDPHHPALGLATAADFGSRVVQNVVNHTVHFSELLTNLRWVDPKWYSPLIVLPFLLVSLGLIRSIWERGRVIELCFVLYAGVYLLWPFDEGARYALPVFPIALLYAWHGMSYLYDRVKGDLPRAARYVSVGSACVFLGSIVSSYQSPPAVGKQAVASMLVWLGLCISMAMVAVKRSPVLQDGFDVRTAARVFGALFALVVAAGFLQQIRIVPKNLQGDPSLLVHLRSIDAAQWLSSRLEPGESVMAGQEAIVHYVTGYRAIGFPVTTDAILIKETIDRYNVRYLVIYRNEKYPYFLPTEEERLTILEQAFPELGAIALQTEDYKICRIFTTSS